MYDLSTSILLWPPALPGQPALQAHFSNLIRCAPGSDINVDEKSLFFVACHEGHLPALHAHRR